MRWHFPRHLRLVAAFALAAVVTGFFVLRAAMFAIDWADPAQAQHPVEGWMTPRYIVHTYHLPPDLLAQVLEAERGDSPRKSLTEIARARGVPLPELIGRIEALIEQGAGASP
ncbi:MAG: hypothetical protein U1D06_01200 [Paracoccaceae bacterium]|nr:hypothetical protein [Paracoccaceae bacterium]